MKNLLLTEIWVYPIKSLGGVSVPSWQVQPKGLAYDRRWMLTDTAGRFLTQRVYPAMALFRLRIGTTGLVVTYKGESLSVPFGLAEGPDENVVIWDDTVVAREVSAAHSAWFSERLGMDCKLMFFPEENARPVDPRYKVNDEHVGLADAYPLLIIGQSSLDDLNTRLADPVPMDRFRPNLVFSGGDPFEEDTWREFTVGTNRFVGVKPCARCVLTTVNQETAERGAEPLRTLATYRKRDNKILFGQNLVSLDAQEISTGMPVTVTSYQ
jgi:uncharacterized protein YcbX